MVKRWIESNGNSNLRWLGDPSGKFSIKSSYLLLKQVQNSKIQLLTGECSDKSNYIMFWRNSWRARVQDKVKNYLEDVP